MKFTYVTPFGEEIEVMEGYNYPPNRLYQGHPGGVMYPPGYYFEGGPSGFESIAGEMIDDLSGKVVDEARWLIEGAKKVPGSLVDFFTPPVKPSSYKRVEAGAYRNPQRSEAQVLKPQRENLRMMEDRKMSEMYYLDEVKAMETLFGRRLAPDEYKMLKKQFGVPGDSWPTR